MCKNYLSISCADDAAITARNEYEFRQNTKRMLEAAHRKNL